MSINNLRRWQTKGGNNVIRVVSGRSNAFLLSNGRQHLLVDSSVSENYRLLAARLKKLGIEKLDALLLTHTHYDHAANACALKKDFRAAILVHEKEAGFLRAGKNIVPSGTNRFSRLLVKIFGRFFTKMMEYKPCEPDRLLRDGDDLSGFGFNARVLATPGHTAGSLCLIVDDEIAIAGDTLFGVFRNSVMPPFAEDHYELLRSWERLLATGCETFLPAHGREKSRSQLREDYLKRMALAPKNQTRSG